MSASFKQLSVNDALVLSGQLQVFRMWCTTALKPMVANPPGDQPGLTLMHDIALAGRHGAVTEQSMEDTAKEWTKAGAYISIIITPAEEAFIADVPGAMERLMARYTELYVRLP